MKLAIACLVRNGGQRAFAQAIRDGYRRYHYGDASLLLPPEER
ncbi:S-adenosylmethionine:tRNA ribosyltransferase-isomerase [Sphingomonas psychrolutea]|nr:S-adenosylmethionine:tRNA ribosyltransferase-isomerase [Sphingomonas psychrolutea]